MRIVKELIEIWLNEVCDTYYSEVILSIMRSTSDVPKSKVLIVVVSEIAAI